MRKKSLRDEQGMWEDFGVRPDNGRRVTLHRRLLIGSALLLAIMLGAASFWDDDVVESLDQPTSQAE